MSGSEDGNGGKRMLMLLKISSGLEGRTRWKKEGRQLRPMDLAVQREGREKWLRGTKNIKSRPWDSVSLLAACCVWFPVGAICLSLSLSLIPTQHIVVPSSPSASHSALANLSPTYASRAWVCLCICVRDSKIDRECHVTQARHYMLPVVQYLPIFNP